MKILYLIYFDGNSRGGHASHARGVVNALERAGSELCLIGPGWRGRASSSVRVIDVWQWRRPGFHTLTFALAMIPRLIAELWRNRPHCIYARYFNLLFPAALVARAFRIPFFTEHNADMQAEHKMYRRGFLLRKFNDLAERMVLANCTGAIVVTQSLLESWQGRYANECQRVTVIRNGVDSHIYVPYARLACIKELGLEEASLYVCYTGSFAEVQGLRFLLEAFASIVHKIPRARLLLVGGSAGELAGIEAKVIALGLSDRVLLVGQVEEAVAAKYICASEICVAPYDRTVALRSRDCGPAAPMKGDPLKIYAYMACARPVIASHFREAGHHVQEIGAGLAVPPEDTDALSNAIVRLLDDESLKVMMGSRGRAYVEEFATWDIVGRKTLEFMSLRIANLNAERA